MLKIKVSQALPNPLQIDIECAPGELHALVGPSGSGKTSVLRTIAGLSNASLGKIECGNQTWFEANELQGITKSFSPAERSCGFLFQQYALFPHLTALENVCIPLQNSEKDLAKRKAIAMDWLNHMGIIELADRLPHQLSGGQQQRVAVARAIALDPPLLIADEPTAHLDYIQVEGVLRLIRELASGERVVVVATHDTRMLPLADRVVELVPHVSGTDHEPETLTLSAGESVFEQGAMGDSIYVVSEGEIELVRVLPGGGEELATTAGPGEYFGEMGPLFALPRSATARARTEATVISYTVQAFRELMGSGGSRDIIEHRRISPEPD